jgi:putative tricarboxylic transport membrane protein
MSKDFLAGLMFAAFGAAGLWLGRGLDKGTASAMGAGYFPTAISLILVVLGLVLAAVSLLRAGERPTGWDWRAFTFIILSGIAFAVLLKPLGLVATLIVTVVVASLAARLLGPVPTLLLAAALVVVNVGIFVLALGMPIALWPRWS